MTWKQQIDQFTVAEIVTTLGCPATTAYGWKDGTRKPPEWQQPHWLVILRSSKGKARTSRSKKREL